MTGVQVLDVPPEGRASLEPILEESFEGWYLRHALRTLKDIDLVREATVDGRRAGLTMLTSFYDTIGYVFYVAVAPEFRRKKIGGVLLDDALSHFRDKGLKEVYASVEGHNVPSVALFKSRGFVPTSFGQVSRRVGKLRAIVLYRRMLVVPGERLLYKPLDQTALA